MLSGLRCVTLGAVFGLAGRLGRRHAGACSPRGRTLASSYPRGPRPPAPQLPPSGTVASGEVIPTSGDAKENHDPYRPCGVMAEGYPALKCWRLAGHEGGHIYLAPEPEQPEPKPWTWVELGARGHAGRPGWRG